MTCYTIYNVIATLIVKSLVLLYLLGKGWYFEQDIQKFKIYRISI